ncbi:MAG: hypothetical protein V1746_06005, partial [bacterium]
CEIASNQHVSDVKENGLYLRLFHTPLSSRKRVKETSFPLACFSPNPLTEPMLIHIFTLA